MSLTSPVYLYLHAGTGLRYLVFPALFLSIGMVFINYMCVTSITEYS